MSTNSMTEHCILTGTNCTNSLTTPQFIDTFHCLCALEPSRASTDSTTELWRCIGNTTDDGTAGGTTGKWWYTVNANANLEGSNEPLNSARDPPDLGKAYVLAGGENGEWKYAVYNGTGVEMVDEGCTAKNDTKASAQYYGERRAAAAASHSAVEPGVDNGSSNSDCYAIGVKLSYAKWYFTSNEDSSIDIATLRAVFLGVYVTVSTVTDASYLPSSISIHIKLRTAAGLVQLLPIASISATTAPWPLKLVDQDRYLKQNSRKAMATPRTLRQNHTDMRVHPSRTYHKTHTGDLT